VSERAKVPLPQLKPSVYGPYSHTEGEGDGLNAKNLFFEKNVRLFADIGSFLYFCKKYTNLCHQMAYPCCTFAEKFENIW